MDTRDFDALARRIFTATNRRAVFAGLAGGLAMLIRLLVPPDVGARKKRKKRGRCHPLGKKCAPGRRRGCCGKAKCRRGRCRCAKRQKSCNGRCIPRKRRCPCRGGQQRCGKRCVNLNRSARNCGACGFACAGTATCQAGLCAGGGAYREVRRWNAPDPEAPWTPFGIAVDRAGLAYVTDPLNHLIWKLTASGDPLDNWPVAGIPVGIDVAPDGVIYVSVEDPYQIQTFTSDGSPASPTIDTQDNHPAGLAVGARDYVYVAFPEDLAAVRRFNPDGTPNATWHGFSKPAWTAVAPSGDVYVTDEDADGVIWLSAAGEVQGGWGDSGTGDGQFLRPFGITVDAAGFVYVADLVGRRVQKFTAGGQFAGALGDPGAPDGFVNPIDVAVSRSGMVYVTDELGGEVIQFAPG